MMAHRWKLSIDGLNINTVTLGETPEIEIEKLRNHVAGKIPGFLGKKYRQAKEALDVDGKGDWTDKECFTYFINYLNLKHGCNHPIPTTAQEFVNLAIEMKICTEIPEA